MEGYYINLSHRTDRKKHIEALQKDHVFFKDIERFNGILHEKYGVGCCLSHIHCLELCLNRNDSDSYLIIEDDFCIMNETNFNDFHKEFDKIKHDTDWDVITLTPYGDTQQRNYKENFHKIVNTQTATGYIIKHSFIYKLLAVLREGLQGLLKGYDGPNPNPYFNDQCWKPLQKKSVWLYFANLYGSQLPSYSDILKKNVDYTKSFLSQAYR